MRCRKISLPLVIALSTLFTQCRAHNPAVKVKKEEGQPNAGDANKNPAIPPWSAQEMEAAKNACTGEFLKSQDPKATAEQVKTICECLTNVAMQRWTFDVYIKSMLDFWLLLNQQGVMDQCKKNGGIGPVPPPPATGVKWQAPELLETLPGIVTDPVVAQHANGNPVVLFSQKNAGGSYDLIVRRHNGTQWAAPEQVGTIHRSQTKASISVNSKGVMALVYISDESPTQVRLNFFNGTTWTGNVQVNNGSTDYAYDASVSVDENNHLYVLWTEGLSATAEDGGETVKFRKFNGTAWENAQDVGHGFIFSPRLAVLANDHVAAIWEDDLGDDSVIRGASYRAGNWSAPVTLDQSLGSPRYSTSPKIVADGIGNAHVVWTTDISGASHIYAVSYANTMWSAVARISNNSNGYKILPEIAVNKRGEAIATWASDDMSRRMVWVNRYVPAQGWQADTVLESNSTYPSYNPRVALNDVGQALVAWVKQDAALFHVWGATFDGKTWTKELQVETLTDGDAFAPGTAMTATGQGFVSWRQGNGTNDNLYFSFLK